MQPKLQENLYFLIDHYKRLLQVEIVGNTRMFLSKQHVFIENETQVRAFLRFIDPSLLQHKCVLAEIFTQYFTHNNAHIFPKLTHDQEVTLGDTLLEHTHHGGYFLKNFPVNHGD